MPPIVTTTTDLWSVETINRLVTEPLFASSVALRTLTPLRTAATSVSIPSVGSGTAAFVAEMSPLPDAEVESAMITIRPKKVGAVQTVSRESSRDAAAAPIIGRAIVNGLASTIDKALFTGDAGTASPTGLPGLDHQDVNDDPGTITDLDVVAEAIAAVETAGGTADTLYCSPSVWEHWTTLKVAEASAQPLLHQPGALADATTRSVYGLRVEVSRHVDDDVAWVIDSTRVLAVVREPIELAVSEHERFSEDAVVIRATSRVEFAAPDPDVIVAIAAGS